MSVFVRVVRYDDDGADCNSFEQISEADLKSAVNTLPAYRVITEDGAIGIRMTGIHNVAVLESTGVLTIRIDHKTDTSLLLDALRKLAASIPGAVVEDEEGNTC